MCKFLNDPHQFIKHEDLFGLSEILYVEGVICYIANNTKEITSLQYDRIMESF